MTKSFIVEQLDSKTVDEIAQAVSDLSKQRGANKQLPLVLNNTHGDFKLAIGLAKKIHDSNVDLIIEAHGSLDASGTILCAAGKKGERHASLDTVFSPFEANDRSVRTDRLSPKNQSVLSALACLKAHRRGLKSIAPKSETLSATEAKTFRIVDKVDKFESKYKDEKKKSSRKKSSKR